MLISWYLLPIDWCFSEKIQKIMHSDLALPTSDGVYYRRWNITEKRSWLTFVILLTDIYTILSTFAAVCAVEKGSYCLLSPGLAYIPTLLLKKKKKRLKEYTLLL